MLEVIHSDMCGLIRKISIVGAHYFETFSDDKSQFISVYLLKSKDENGTQYVNLAYENFLKISDIKRQPRVPYIL